MPGVSQMHLVWVPFRRWHCPIPLVKPFHVLALFADPSNRPKMRVGGSRPHCEGPDKSYHTCQTQKVALWHLNRTNEKGRLAW